MMLRKLFEWLGTADIDNETPQVGGIFGKMTPEALCDINPKKMDKEEIRKQLASLYKRHNQAASSLNRELREEAEEMLDAIVHCREKYVD